MSIRIHCSSHSEADAIWQEWQQLIRPLPAELHVDGHGLVATFRPVDGCGPAPHEAQSAHSC